MYCNCVFFIPIIPSIRYPKWNTLCVYCNILHPVLIVGHVSRAATSYAGIKNKLLLVQEKLDIAYILDAIKFLSQKKLLKNFAFCVNLKYKP